MGTNYHAHGNWYASVCTRLRYAERAATCATKPFQRAVILHTRRDWYGWTIAAYGFTLPDPV